MIVHVALRLADYENSVLIGVAETPEKAQELCCDDYHERKGLFAVFNWGPNFHDPNTLEGQVKGDFHYYLITPTEVV